ncbi:MAG: hypothetical protein LBN39_07640 [Planctomycetaceae bacterium]|jgi:hypothetical protein|nr:hypothetical protein [Planctomycetaceae bacterium]
MPTPAPMTTGTVSRYPYTATIPAGQTEVKVRLVPVFDWLDEGVLFDPFGSGTPNDDTGEFAKLVIRNNPGTAVNPNDSDIQANNTPLSHTITSGSCGVWWNGLYAVADNDWWDPVEHGHQTAKVEIKDGAILELYLDYDGNGTLDVEKSVLDKDCYVPHNDDDDNYNNVADKLDIGGVSDEDELSKAKLYAWVETPGDYTFDVY